ncbi:MAG: hypothetical protein QJR07_21285 [Acetobacteraceae bacterium]|nr:hypothetical protein [Acetobacteraceae bacterium]MDI3309612.1 hypothetical protein [Acetobacteraceae bacterium]
MQRFNYAFDENDSGDVIARTFQQALAEDVWVVSNSSGEPNSSALDMTDAAPAVASLYGVLLDRAPEARGLRWLQGAAGAA